MWKRFWFFFKEVLVEFQEVLECSVIVGKRDMEHSMERVELWTEKFHEDNAVYFLSLPWDDFDLKLSTVVAINLQPIIAQTQLRRGLYWTLFQEV